MVEAGRRWLGGGLGLEVGGRSVISTITTQLARSDNTCEGGVEPTENIYKIRERAVARHLFSFPNSQNVVLSVLSVATLRVASMAVAFLMVSEPWGSTHLATHLLFSEQYTLYTSHVSTTASLGCTFQLQSLFDNALSISEAHFQK